MIFDKDFLPQTKRKGKFSRVVGGVRDMNRKTIISKFKHFNISIVGGDLNGSTNSMIQFCCPSWPQGPMLRQRQF